MSVRSNFFFQAEDGIRDLTVTGVQTCALPISLLRGADPFGAEQAQFRAAEHLQAPGVQLQGTSRQFGGVPRETGPQRSEERRVGKECRAGWWPYQEKKSQKH